MSSNEQWKNTEHSENESVLASLKRTHQRHVVNLYLSGQSRQVQGGQGHTVIKAAMLPKKLARHTASGVRWVIKCSGMTG